MAEEEALTREQTLQPESEAYNHHPEIITESIIHQDNTPVQLPISPRKSSASSSHSNLEKSKSSPRLSVNVNVQNHHGSPESSKNISPPVRPLSISTYTSDEETNLAKSAQKLEENNKEQPIYGSVQSKISEYSSTYRPIDDTRKQSAVSIEETEVVEDDEVIDVSIVKRPGAGLGFAISERILDDGTGRNKGFIIQSIVPGGAASATHEIIGGDQLISVEGKPLEGLALKDVVNVLKGLSAGIINVGIRKQPKVIQGKLRALTPD